MLQAWLSIGYIVLLAILVLAFILWRKGLPVLGGSNAGHGAYLGQSRNASPPCEVEPQFIIHVVPPAILRPRAPWMVRPGPSGSQTELPGRLNSGNSSLPLTFPWRRLRSAPPIYGRPVDF